MARISESYGTEHLRRAASGMQTTRRCLARYPQRDLDQEGAAFDPRFQFHFYDLDFCRQAEQRGLKMGTWALLGYSRERGQARLWGVESGVFATTL